jgi:hypothetical protein
MGHAFDEAWLSIARNFGHDPYVNEFIEEVKASGLVQGKIDSVGLRGVQVVGVLRWI